MNKDLIKNIKSWAIAVIPTDTCYGFSCIYDNPDSIAKIQEIKKRGCEKPFSLLFSSLDEAKKYCQINSEQEAYINDNPNQTSFIVDKWDLLSDYFPKFNSVSIRIESSWFPMRIVKYVWKPITTTSVNISWKDILSTKKDILDNFGSFAFLYFVFNDNLNLSESSTIWDIRSMPPIKIR